VIKIKRRLTEITRPLLVRNLNFSNKVVNKKALLYYKTGGFLKKGVINYTHTNEWEIFKMVSVLNNLGYSVDIVDRNKKNFIPKNIYDLFIGLAAGDSGKFYKKYATLLPKAIKVALCAGPEPALSAKLVIEQYDRFNKRHGTNIKTMRVPTIDFNSFAAESDAILAIGESDTFCPDTYKIHNKPLYTYFPGCSPKIKFSQRWFQTRDMNKFICFAGNGFVCKGVDLVVEVFSKHPELTLHICGPDDEKGFFEVLGPTIKSCDNIIYEGFVGVGGKKFEELSSSCSFVIFNSSAEGCATSVTTMMTAGLVPVLNYETGINIDDCGIYIHNIDSKDRVDSTEKAALKACNLTKIEYAKLVSSTLKESEKYTQKSFTKSIGLAFKEIIKIKP